jgi:hypothetical protein
MGLTATSCIRVLPLCTRPIPTVIKVRALHISPNPVDRTSWSTYLYEECAGQWKDV